MKAAEGYSEMRRAVGYGVIVSILLLGASVVFNLVVDDVISTVETVVAPCQHGGVWTGEKCECVGPFGGSMCERCDCVHGQCDQLHVVPFTNSLFGCRCYDAWLGSYCDLCTSEKDEDGNCNGKCLSGYTGSKCGARCVPHADFTTVLENRLGEYSAEVDLWLAGGTLSACSGHGTCINSTNECSCEPHWFPSADSKSQCARTCTASPQTGKLCHGHGECSETNNIISCACQNGYHLKNDCSVACPGMDVEWSQEPCSGRGVCSLDGDKAVCECTSEIYIGDACQFKCPSLDSSTPCSGHGTCSLVETPFTLAQCQCDQGWKGPSCQCNDAQTCSGHGTCTASGTCTCATFWTGKKCNTCERGRFGSQCQLLCDERKATDSTTPDDDIGCNSRGVCSVFNFARADEAAVCGCAGNFDPTTHCRDCKQYYYPKIGESGLPTPVEDAAVACQTFANRASCNRAGEPKLGFSSGASSGPPCQCDQPHVDGNTFCTKCKATFFPDGGDMSDPNACSKRCVDSGEHPSWMEGIFTLVCKNQGTCDATGEVCVCPSGYSGKDCSVACGGGTPCSGHGQCVSNILEQFLSAEVKNSAFGGASHHCECDPQRPTSDGENLKIFKGEEVIGGDQISNTLEYMGDFCQFSCLKPGWLDAITCNRETCAALPILDNQGSPIITYCTQDSDCGEYLNGLLVFRDANGAPRQNLTPDENELRAQLSLQNRWSPRMGPFCKVPTVPRALHTASMKCVQRVNVDSRNADTEAICEAQTTKVKCLSQSGNCRWADTCLEALDEFDEFSYCYELMRTERPPALRSENCTASCNTDQLATVEWQKVCDRYASRVPPAFQNCSQDLDSLCEEGVDTTDRMTKCADTLPTANIQGLGADEAVSLCWETRTVLFPFQFEPLLDTTSARQLQSNFHPHFVDMGKKHDCANRTMDVAAACNAMNNYAVEVERKILYACEIGGQTLLKETDLAGTNVFCTTRSTVEELSPFVLSCAGEDRLLEGVTLLEAVDQSLDSGCSLQPKSDVHALGVGVSADDANRVCSAVLDSERPDECKAVCGEDPCADLGTTHLGIRLFRCLRDDPATVSAESCLLGSFSLTGKEGGGEYLCAVSGNLLKPATPSSFLECDGALVLHADRLGFDSNPKTSGLDGKRSVVSGTVHAATGRSPLIRLEFDVEIASASRGAVTVLGKKANGNETVLASVLLHHFGGLGWNLNGKPDEESCAAGEGDTCKTKVEVGTSTRVTLEINASHVTATFGDDNATEPIAGEIEYGNLGTFEGVSVSGSARVKQLFVVKAASQNIAETCTRLHRKIGRSVTWSQSLQDASTNPKTSLGYCANMERAFGTGQCEKGSSAEIDSVFGVPWRGYCAYYDHIASLGATCDAKPSTRAEASECSALLGRFDSVACGRDAVAFDWEQQYCQPLRNDTAPDILSLIGCDSECLREVERSDLGAFCEDRKDYWENEAAKPRVPAGCADTTGAQEQWRSQDWTEWCLAKASNTAKGTCSAATCDCSLNGGFLGGDSCELACSLGSDGSVCNEASFSGVCDYPGVLAKKADEYYEDETKLILGKRAGEFNGVCRCANSEALAGQGCDLTCDTEDGKPLCNNRTYAEQGEQWQISACHKGGTGVCACLPLLTRQVTENVSDWRGNKAEVLSFEYGGLPATAPWADQFRVRASQGAKSLMVHLYNYSESTWRTARQKFELEPALFPCGGRQCDFSDVVLAQSLYTTSSFYGPTCSRRCPSVDTGEALQPISKECASEKAVRADRLTLEACQNECFDEWRCRFLRFNNKTSDCRLYETCEDVSPGSPSQGDFVSWYERRITGTPSMTPCSGRGACTMTGTCVCDSAKFLSLTDPITGKRARVQADQRSTLAEVPVTSLDTTGFRGEDCSLVCPGFDPEISDMSQVCSGHGLCTRSATCQCAPGYTGLNCEYACPSMDAEEDTTTTCSGHGTCSEGRITVVESSVDKEDVLQQYQLSEAWRKWYNACPENTPVDYFVLPFGNFPGVVDQTTMKGGVECALVPQQKADDTTKKYVERPVVELTALRDFELLDSERNLDYDTNLTVDGRSSDALDKREGVFRRRYWNESGWKSQNVFVEGFDLVQLEDGRQYEKFPGFRCDGEALGERKTGILNVGLCAARCEDQDGCVCFDYQENYHSAFLGGCRLAKAGKLRAYPVHKVRRVGASDGLLEMHADGDLLPFEEFVESYVVLQADKSCRATAVVIGENVATLEACAKLCDDKNDQGCVFFTWTAQVLRCYQVKTSSSSCPEGFSVDPSGFYAISRVNQGAAAPVAYDASGSARLFPKDKVRGTVSGTFAGRARPEWTIGVAVCSCSRSFSFGHWSGFACNSCLKHWGGESCTRQCAGVVAGEPCFGNGKCLWGSKDGLGEPGTFYDATCLCGDPPAPKASDLALTGTWLVEEKDLHVEVTFQKMSTVTPFFEDPNNYGFSDSTCRSCVEKRGGRNCASQCSTCLFSGSCQFSISESISVPCLCTSQYYDSQNGCAPHGWILDEQTISADVGGLQAALRARRLETQPGLDAAVGTFYDKANFPDVQTSMFPSRRFTMPCPNVNEAGSWMKDLSAAPSRACKRAGQCRDTGPRKLKLPGMPSRYFPLACSELGEDWASSPRDLFFTYEEKIATNGSASSEMTYFGEGPNADADYSDPQYGNLSTSEFVKGCRQQCISLGNCASVVVKRLYGTKKAWCYYSANSVVVSPSSGFMLIDPNAMFTTYQLKREYDFCVNGLKWCSLGSVGYGDIDLCADVALQKQGEDSTSDSGLQTATLTMGNLGKRCEVDVSTVAGTTDWQVKSGTDCDVSDNSKVRVHDENSAVIDYAPGANAMVLGAFNTSKFSVSAAKVSATFGKMRPENPCSAREGYFWNVDDRTTCKNLDTGDTCDIEDWKTCPGKQFDSDKLSLHSVHERRAMLPHRLLMDGADLEVTLIKAEFNWNIRAVNTASIQAQIDTLKDALSSTKSWLNAFLSALATATTNYNTQKAGHDAAMVLLNNYYPACCPGGDPCYGYLQVTKCPAYGQYANAVWQWDIVTTKEAMDNAQNLVNLYEDRVVSEEKAIADLEADMVSNQADLSCTSAQKCDVCQGNCQSDDECLEGLVCYEKGAPMTSGAVQIPTYSCGSADMPGDGNKYCVHDPTMLISEKDNYETFIAGYVSQPGVYSSKVVAVDPTSRLVVIQFAESHNVLTDSENTPSSSASVVSKRASALLTQSVLSSTVVGYATLEGTAGLVPRPEKSLLDVNEPRTFRTGSAQECRLLCEETAGCTAASVKTQVNSQGVALYKCTLHTFSLPENVDCDSALLVDLAGLSAQTMLLKPERCGLCKVMGMLTAESPNPSQVHCAKRNKLSDYCEVFPTGSVGVTTTYAWSDRMCAPVRSGFDKMYTSVVRVGKSFKLDEVSPYLTIDGHPDIQAFSRCESLCAEDRKCAAWHFRDLLSPERGDDHVDHVCELFSYVPPVISTSSVLENVFSGRTRIGIVQRDFSADVDVFADDGNNAACLCGDDTDAEGYDCGCKAISPTPYTGFVLNDNVWGCSGHGRCGGTGYFCSCDDGYEFAWGAEQNNLPAGFTCRACAAGQFKNSDVEHCTPCPVGSYQTQTGMAQCTACPQNNPSTPTTGAIASLECMSCPAGRVAGAMANSGHTKPLNSNYNDATTLCTPCPVGKFDSGFATIQTQLLRFGTGQQRVCQNCPNGYTTSTYGMGYCDVDVLPGECNEPGMAWEHPDDMDPEVLGGARCVLCPQGRYKSENSVVCQSCPSGFSTSTVGGTDCTVCPLGYFAAEEAQMGCDECPSGYFQNQQGKLTCGFCTAGKFSAAKAASCAPCDTGKYSNDNAQSSCKACAGGRYSDAGTGQTDVVVCKACIGGKYSDAGEAQTAISVCKVCVGGRYSDAGEAQATVAVCKECERGKYQDEEGQTSCSNCDAGKYQSQLGQNSESDCIPCLVGVYSTAGQAECTDCAAGKYQNDNSQTSESACKDCEVGKYNDEDGQQSCKKCAAGKYQDEVAQTSVAACKDCEAGKFQNEEGEQECEDCWKGRYSNEIGLAEYCKPCPGGKYNDEKAKTVIQDCKQCSAGMFTDTADANSHCMGCAAGKTPNSAQTGCQACSDGKYSTYSGTGGLCQLCPVGFHSNDDVKALFSYCSSIPHKECCRCFYFGGISYYQDEEGQGSCKQCPTGKSHFADGLVFKGCADCPAGKYQNEPPKLLNFGTDDASAGCKNCSAGTYQDQDAQISCESCPVETYQDGEGAEACKVCQAESPFGYQDEVAQTGCKICPAPSQVNPNNAVALSSCQCPKGFYTTGQTGAWGVCTLGTDCPCMFCSPNQFTDTRGAADCKSCPSGFHSLQLGETECIADPICEAGKRMFNPTTQDGNNLTSMYCGDCFEGTYNSVNGSNSCDDCAAGQYQDEKGSTACKGCLSGSYQDEEAQSDCKTCPSGWQSGNSFSSCTVTYAGGTTVCSQGKYGVAGLVAISCENCDPGYYQDEEAQSDCKGCLSGSYQDEEAQSDCKTCPSGWQSGSEAFRCTALLTATPQARL